ncbi:hypothetical protein AAFF_G00271590 [Aldrovandia affinis]|uniref:Apoptosis-associated speck-like protein containing a CARD n=1 Tax=Aldrovandia affinis TaxID=143900 RepID=A0AAD7RDF7_9TELE|nr:hypothetical protein AAFF_G00271590 [Aldrovandia affinis]
MAVDDLIRGALDNLSAEHLDKFKHKLSTLHKIGYGLIEKESNIAITRRIIDKFGKKNAIARTAEVLRAIDLNGEADDLEEAYAGQGGASAAGTGGVSAAGTGGGVSASGSGSTQTEGQHFVEKHQLELIERVKMVKSILDQLLHQKLIDGEKYEFIMAKTTTRDQMRKLLYDVIYPGGRELKDALYWILEKKDPVLMRDLKGK